jgi:uncharacterized membrane protein
MTWSERFADRMAAVIGSWRFILFQLGVLIAWVVVNVFHIFLFDEYPFILLNLFLSVQAAFTGPVLLLSANRQALKDRKRSVKNFVIDKQDHEIIMRMEEHLDRHMHGLRTEVRALIREYHTNKNDHPV